MVVALETAARRSLLDRSGLDHAWATAALAPLEPTPLSSAFRFIFLSPLLGHRFDPVHLFLKTVIVVWLWFASNMSKVYLALSRADVVPAHQW